MVESKATTRAPRLFAVRHGPVGLSDLCYGRLDVEAPVSMQDVALLVQELRAVLAGAEGERTELWTSPRRRCLAVTAHLAPLFSVVHQDARLSELDRGTFEGRTYAELAHEPSFRHWSDHWESARPPGGETLSEFIARTTDCLRELRAAPARVILLSTHAGVIRALRAALGAHPLALELGRPVPHLSLVELGLPPPA